MKLKNPMLVVTDMDKTVEFYKRVLGLWGVTGMAEAGSSDLSVSGVLKKGLHTGDGSPFLFNKFTLFQRIVYNQRRRKFRSHFRLPSRKFPLCFRQTRRRHPYKECARQAFLLLSYMCFRLC